MSAFVDPLGCTACPRLADHLANIRQRDPNWHALPVPAFGDLSARLLVVGLAPGEKGANRTGRPFTGDVAGELLYPALHRFGFATAATPLAEDGWANPAMQLIDCRITNAVRCLPPANKPTPEEIRRCNDFLKIELAAMPNLRAILALGAIAHQSVLRAFGCRAKDFVFGHNVRHQMPGAGAPVLFDSYHTSGYNWRTGRITQESFDAVFVGIRSHLDG